MYKRSMVVDLARSWVGKKESNNSYREIIDIYNSWEGPFPRGIKMKYSWAWCACTWSALAIKLGYTKIMPIEISCNELIKIAKKMGIWVENDGYVPKSADAILYDWQDNGAGDNTGVPDHIGVVETVHEDAGYFVVIEGNYSDEVKRRTVSVNGKFIRGFITPKYDEDGVNDCLSKGLSLKEVALEVIAGKWGDGDTRKTQLSSCGYDPVEVQSIVNKILNDSATIYKYPIQNQNQPIEKKVKSSCFAKSADKSLSGIYITTADLYCRNDAGKNKKALCLIPKGTAVKNYGYYTKVGDIKWYYICFTMDGVEYTGFSSENYLSRYSESLN